MLWLGSVSTSCLERQGAEAGHGSPKIRAPSEVPGKMGARLAPERGAWGQKALNLGEFFQLKSIRDVKGLLKQPYFLNLIRQKKPGYSTLLIACRGGRAEAGAAAPRALAPLPRAAPRHLGVTGTLSALLPRADGNSPPLLRATAGTEGTRPTGTRIEALCIFSSRELSSLLGPGARQQWALREPLPAPAAVVSGPPPRLIQPAISIFPCVTTEAGGVQGRSLRPDAGWLRSATSPVSSLSLLPAVPRSQLCPAALALLLGVSWFLPCTLGVVPCTQLRSKPQRSGAGSHQPLFGFFFFCKPPQNTGARRQEASERTFPSWEAPRAPAALQQASGGAEARGGQRRELTARSWRGAAAS